MASSSEDVEAVLAQCHAENKRIRVVGNALSPNGIALSEEGMLSVCAMDKVLSVDCNEMTVSKRRRILEFYCQQIENIR